MAVMEDFKPQILFGRNILRKLQAELHLLPKEGKNERKDERRKERKEGREKVAEEKMKRKKERRVHFAKVHLSKNESYEDMNWSDIQEAPQQPERRKRVHFEKVHLSNEESENEPEDMSSNEWDTDEEEEEEEPVKHWKKIFYASLKKKRTWEDAPHACKREEKAPKGPEDHSERRSGDPQEDEKNQEGDSLSRIRKSLRRGDLQEDGRSQEGAPLSKVRKQKRSRSERTNTRKRKVDEGRRWQKAGWVQESEYPAKKHQAAMDTNYWIMRNADEYGTDEEEFVCYISAEEEDMKKVPRPFGKGRKHYIRQCIHDKLGMDETVLTEQELGRLEEMLNYVGDIFLKDWEMPTVADLPYHRIVTHESRPVKKHPYQISPADAEWLYKTIQKLYRAGLIDATTSEWAAPTVIVHRAQKMNRLCIDYRGANAVTEKDEYPLPRIQDVLDLLGGAKYITILDAASGYHQIPVLPEHRHKTAFTTRFGTFHWNVMPFGLCNGPGSFQRAMDVLLTGLLWKECICYIDDILVFSETFEQHMATLYEIFRRCNRVNLQLRLDKCFFCPRFVIYLGHLISRQGISTNPAKIACVVATPTPRTVKDVRSFLGLAGYYRRYVQHFSQIAHSLHQLLKKNHKFEWTEACQVAFDTLKRALTRSPCLAHPNFSIPFTIYVDASTYGIGACLTQEDRKEQEHVIAYASRGLRSGEIHYAATELEALALVWGVEHFKVYLGGKHFTAVTDHHSLRWLMAYKDSTSRLARWALRLQAYEFEVIHRPGRKHQNADALSRPPICQPYQEEGQPDDTGEDRAFMQVLAITELEEITTEEMADMQTRDKYLGELIAFMKDGDLPMEARQVRRVIAECQTMHLDDNTVLWHVWIPSSHKVREAVWKQLCLPTQLRQLAMKVLHEGKLGGHYGFQRTYLSLKQRFWWPLMFSEILHWVKTCQPCQERKSPHTLMAGLLRPTVFGRPFEQLAVDVMGPFPTTKRGNKYIVVFQDYFTKWPEAFAVPNHQSTTIAMLFVDEVMCRYGMPERLMSDRGTEFLSELMKSVYELLQIHKVNTSPYHPQTDALPERFNSTLQTCLSSMCDINQTDWDEHIPYMLFAYRGTIHATTREEPGYLFLGRRIRRPIDILWNTHDPTARGTPESYQADLQERMEAAQELVKRNCSIAAQYNKTRYDKRHREVAYEVGEKVKIRSHSHKKGKSTKLEAKWAGPYVVVRKVNDLNYELSDEGGKFKGRYHVSNMKKEHTYLPTEQEKDIPQIRRTPPRTTKATNGRRFVKPTDGRRKASRDRKEADRKRQAAQQEAAPLPPSIPPREQEQQRQPREEEEEEEYEVEKVIDHRRRSGRDEYLCTWKGYPLEQTWMAEQDLGNAREAVSDYQRTHTLYS